MFLLGTYTEQFISDSFNPITNVQKKCVAFTQYLVTFNIK